ncbi:MAG: hypothetical protein DRO39_03510 [Thermoprotei archaeon]|nr:MAG: hypothetical protein DRO39_03510 [Thermoprotei archaeon]
MDIYELWEAKRRGKFALKHWVWAWLISTRAIALPWVALYTLFGCLLAGVKDPAAALGAVLTVCFTLLASHFRNNYRDVELGIDRYVDDPGEAEKVVSTLKPYTAAAWLVPLRITSVGFQKANEALFLGLSAAAYALMVLPGHPETLPLYALGVFMAESYTDWWKRWRLGEAAAFLGHGFSTVAFGYLSQSPDALAAALAGVPTGLISALAYSVDQFVDIKTDFVERVRSVYESWFNSRMPLGLYVLVAVALYMNVLTAWVAAGIYPPGTLLAMAIAPPVLLRAPALEWDREGALRDLALLITWLLPALMCIGASLG